MNKDWRDRIAAEMKAREQDDIALSDAMRQLHDFHYRNIEKEIESFYQRYADKEKIDLTEARKRASEIDVSAYQKKAQDLVARADKMRASGKIVTKADFTHKENAEMSIYNLMMKVNRLELLQYNIDLAMQELAEDEYELHEKFLKDGFEQEKAFRASIMADTVPNPKAIGDIAEATINANFKGASWSRSIWKRQDKLRTIVAQEVYQAIIRGQNGLVIARNLRKDFVVNVSDAKRLAITEHARVQIEVAKQSMLRNGFEYYEVLPEPKACGVCKPKAGKKYRVDTMMTSETAPPFHPYCRCAIVEVFEVKGLNDNRKSLDIQPRSDTIRVKDIQLPQPLSAMARDIYVKSDYPVRGDYLIKRGSTITNVEVIAGKDVKRKIDDIRRLVREHGGKVKDWQKVKGHATLSDGRKIEAHWYQAKNVGKVEFKIKRWL